MEINVDELNHKGFLKDFMNDTKECFVCHGHSWKVERTVVEMPEFNPAAGTEHKVYPVVVVCCDNCGFIVPFSAKAVGGVKFLDNTNSSPDTPEHGIDNG